MDLLSDCAEQLVLSCVQISTALLQNLLLLGLEESKHQHRMCDSTCYLGRQKKIGLSSDKGTEPSGYWVRQEHHASMSETLSLIGGKCRTQRLTMFSFT